MPPLPGALRLSCRKSDEPLIDCDVEVTVGFDAVCPAPKTCSPPHGVLVPAPTVPQVSVILPAWVSFQVHGVCAYRGTTMAASATINNIRAIFMTQFS